MVPVPLGIGLLDALTFVDDRQYDLIFDHTFFCALHPEDRPAFGDLARRLIGRGGLVCSIVFPAGKHLDSGGPPWGMETAALTAALGPDFQVIEDRPVADCGHPSWDERWAAFTRV